MNPQLLAKLYHHLNPALQLLSPRLQIKLASRGRSYFMRQFIEYRPRSSFTPRRELTTKLWNIDFRTSLCNSAGMFKNGEGYDRVVQLGAGAYIGGTSTANVRTGNRKNGIHLAFINLPQSHLALNGLGLPNYGDAYLSTKRFTTRKIKGCPIGWSVMRSPDFDEPTGLAQLIQSLWHYHDHSQVDFIEINESCPNVKAGSLDAISRLKEIARQFLMQRRRHLPIVVKLSNDISLPYLKEMLDCLIRCGYDGINLGNTSTAYSSVLPLLHPAETKLFEYFTSQFGGGISGDILKKTSLELCSTAAEILTRLKPDHEFHIIRSGGIDSLADLHASQKHGVSLNQWYTGFFNNYLSSGENVYKKFWDDAEPYLHRMQK